MEKKDMKIKSKKMRILLSACLIFSSLGLTTAYGQFPVPTGPGPAIAVSPAPGAPAQPINPPSNTPPPAGWGGPGFLPPAPANNWQNQGSLNVMASGIDSQGVEKQIPLFVTYQFNGVNYNITVLNAWNPYTYSWDAQVDQPAYSTSYFFNGITYNYYTVLSTGTWYFNL